MDASGRRLPALICVGSRNPALCRQALSRSGGETGAARMFASRRHRRAACGGACFVRQLLHRIDDVRASAFGILFRNGLSGRAAGQHADAVGGVADLHGGNAHRASGARLDGRGIRPGVAPELARAVCAFECARLFQAPVRGDLSGEFLYDGMVRPAVRRDFVLRAFAGAAAFFL